jgi:hypothetical protein
VPAMQRLDVTTLSPTNVRVWREASSYTSANLIRSSVASAL